MNTPTADPLHPIDPARGSTSTILVVDDTPLDRRLAGRLIEKEGGLVPVYAADGAEALEKIEAARPAAVVTDLQMPGMDGLRLVEEVRARFPEVPVVLMTGSGSEDIAIQALQSGAASYVPKRALARDLISTLQRILQAARVDRRQQRILDAVTEVEYRFVLDNDPALVPPLVAHLQDHLSRVTRVGPSERVRAGVALEEALLNGLYHGNLELDSQLRQDGGDRFERMGRERRHQPPYMHRRLHVHARFSRPEAVFEIRDEGPGFNPKTLPDPTDPANIDRISGRGLLLIQTLMDCVRHNDAGNAITMVKRGRE